MSSSVICRCRARRVRPGSQSYGTGRRAAGGGWSSGRRRTSGATMAAPSGTDRATWRKVARPRERLDVSWDIRQYDQGRPEGGPRGVLLEVVELRASSSGVAEVSLAARAAAHPASRAPAARTCTRVSNEALAGRQAGDGEERAGSMTMTRVGRENDYAGRRVVR